MVEHLHTLCSNAGDRPTAPLRLAGPPVRDRVALATSPAFPSHGLSLDAHGDHAIPVRQNVKTFTP